MDKGIILHIELSDFRPKIWRRFIISSETTFYDLHLIIQKVMGWDNAHLFHFYTFGTNRDYIGQNWSDTDYIEASKTPVKYYLSKKGDKIYYEYDFGDGWEHVIQVKELKKDEKQRDGNYPRCIDGAMACPLEDCGGVWGYAQLLDILANPKHPRYKDMKEWVQCDVNPEKFDIEKVNKMLR